MKRSPGIRHLDNLKVGIDELQWAQSASERHAGALELARMHRPGLILGREIHGSPSGDWRAVDQGNGQIKINGASVGGTALALTIASRAIDGNGIVFGTSPSEDYDPGDVIPDDTTWYTILVEAGDDQIEEGTLTVATGAAAVVGVGTKFTRYSGKTTDAYGRGSLVRIDAADTSNGNAGTIEIDTVTDDLNMTLIAAVAGTNESGIPFRIAGDFLGATPADPDCHSMRRVKVTVVAALRETGDHTRFAVCDVRRTGTSLEIVDRRFQSAYRMAEPAKVRGVIPVVGTRPKVAVDYELTRAVRDLSGPACSHIAMTQQTQTSSNVTSKVVVAGKLTGGALETWTSGLDNADAAASTVSVEASGVSGRPGLLTLFDLDKIVLVYVHDNKVKMRTSTDNSATWSAATTLMDPTLVAAADTVAEPHIALLSNGRILVSFAYLDHSLSLTRASFVYSDDYSENWHDNGGAGGYVLTPVALGIVTHNWPWVAEAADGTVWCVVEGGGGNLHVYATPRYNVLASGVWTTNSTTGKVWSSDGASSELRDPSLVAADTGQMVLFSSEYVPTSHNGIMSATLSIRSGGDAIPDWISQRFMVEEVSVPSTQRHSSYPCRLESGALWVAYVTTANTNKAQLVHLVETR